MSDPWSGNWEVVMNGISTGVVESNYRVAWEHWIERHNMFAWSAEPRTYVLVPVTLQPAPRGAYGKATTKEQLFYTEDKSRKRSVVGR